MVAMHEYKTDGEDEENEDDNGEELIPPDNETARTRSPQREFPEAQNRAFHDAPAEVDKLKTSSATVDDPVQAKATDQRPMDSDIEIPNNVRTTIAPKTRIQDYEQSEQQIGNSMGERKSNGIQKLQPAQRSTKRHTKSNNGYRLARRKIRKSDVNEGGNWDRKNGDEKGIHPDIIPAQQSTPRMSRSLRITQNSKRKVPPENDPSSDSRNRYQNRLPYIKMGPGREFHIEQINDKDERKAESDFYLNTCDIPIQPQNLVIMAVGFDPDGYRPPCEICHDRPYEDICIRCGLSICGSEECANHECSRDAKAFLGR